MNVTFTVEVALERTQGKFAPRDEVVEAIHEQLEQAASEGVFGVGADGDSEYEVTDYTITEEVQTQRKAKAQ